MIEIVYQQCFAAKSSIISEMTRIKYFGCSQSLLHVTMLKGTRAVDEQLFKSVGATHLKQS